MKPMLQSGWNGTFFGFRDQWKNFRNATALQLESKNSGCSRYLCTAMASYYMINIVFSHAFLHLHRLHPYTAGSTPVTDVSRSSTGISSNQPRFISTPALNRILPFRSFKPLPEHHHRGDTRTSRRRTDTSTPQG